MDSCDEYFMPEQAQEQAEEQQFFAAFPELRELADCSSSGHDVVEVCSVDGLHSLEIVCDGDMVSARGCIDIDADPDLLYRMVTDYDLHKTLFKSVKDTKVIGRDGKKKKIRQVLEWRFLRYTGEFTIESNIVEDPESRSVQGKLAKGSFVRKFDTATRIQTVGIGRSRVEVELQMQPAMFVPPGVRQFVQGFANKQVTNMLAKLKHHATGSELHLAKMPGWDSSPESVMEVQLRALAIGV